MGTDFFRLFYRKVSEHNKNIIYIIIGRGRPYLLLLQLGIHAIHLSSNKGR